jgi:uncharacterized protein (DUF2141 family)
MKLTHLAVAVLPALLLAACGGEAAPRRAAERPPGTGTLDVKVVGFQRPRGHALVNVFLDPDGFPDEPDKAWRAIERRIVGARVEFSIEDVPAGPVAVSVFHDEDDDRELDTGLFGIPAERWGVSRDAGGFLGPPSFEAAMLELKAGERLTIEIPIG